MPRRPTPLPLLDASEHLADQKASRIEGLPFTSRDFRALKAFLLQYRNNKATYESYRRELERLIQWAWPIAKKSVLRLLRSDIEAYLVFCQKPPQAWIGTKRVARFITKNGRRVPNPAWRMFVVTQPKSSTKRGLKPDISQFQFSNSAMTALLSSLSSFYSYLLCENTIKANPVAQLRQKGQYIRKQQIQRKVRRLTELQWNAVIETAEKMATEDPDRHERTLFMMTAFYLMYLRVSELVATARWEPQMGHFFQDSQDRWWFKTVSKGNKERDITVCDGMLKALKRFRKSRGLSPILPLPGEQRSLIQSIRTKKAITTDRPIRVIVQECFDLTARQLYSEGFRNEAKRLQEATVHWLRHTGISDDINKRHRPIAHVRDDAGHSSIAITDLYNDIPQQERHRSARKKQVD